MEINKNVNMTALCKLWYISCFWKRTGTYSVEIYEKLELPKEVPPFALAFFSSYSIQFFDVSTNEEICQLREGIDYHELMNTDNLLLLDDGFWYEVCGRSVQSLIGGWYIIWKVRRNTRLTSAMNRGWPAYKDFYTHQPIFPEVKYLINLIIKKIRTSFRKIVMKLRVK